MADDAIKSGHEGGLQAPTRHALGWQEPAFYDSTALEKELDRVFDICHGCRRCFNLCNAFPTLFDLIDASKTGEVNGVDKKDYGQVVDQCYLCDMCYMTKCPYVPPHPWNVDFPHLMLRAKAVKHRNGGTRWRDQVLSSTDTVGAIAGIPVVVEAVNAVNKSPWGRKLLDSVLHVHPEAPVPAYVSKTARKQLAAHRPTSAVAQSAGGTSQGQIRRPIRLIGALQGESRGGQCDQIRSGRRSASAYPACSRLAGTCLLRHCGAREGTRPGIRHLPRMPPLFQFVQHLSDAIRPD